MSRRFTLSKLLATAFLMTACVGDPKGPDDERSFSITAQGGDRQFAAATATLAEPLRAVVTDASNSAPVKGITVQWRMRSGSGVTFEPSTGVTDADGVVTTRIKLGPFPGEYTVEAVMVGPPGAPAVFTAVAVQPPQITAFPRVVNAGQTITLTGSNFRPTATDNTVTIAGMSATVLLATPTELRVTVPACLPTLASVPLKVSLGAVAGTPVTVDVTAGNFPAVQLARGQVTSIYTAAALVCVRLPADPTSVYLLVPSNGADVPARTLPFQLLGINGNTTATTSFVGAHVNAGTLSFAESFEARLRERERSFRAPSVLDGPAPTARMRPPTVGERREFNVINKDNAFTKVTAVVRAVSRHAVMYEDVNTPPNGFTAADYEAFGRVFDDPIYDTDVRVFGAPSDIDQNGVVAMLFTPVVNAMTPQNATSYIAGFFFGCDLVEKSECSGTNRAEVFYAAVPDLEAKFSIRHSKEEVFRTLQPVIAHEFQHMIHFNQRVLMKLAASQESQWLSEGLAHMAEDTVGGVFRARGDDVSAFDFQRQNYLRAHRYLQDPTRSTLLSYIAPGSLEERGAAWLFMRYLMGRFTYDILGKVTRTGAASTANVSAQTGTPWNVLVNDWAVAMFMDDAPELSGIVPEARYTYPDIDLRKLIGQPAIAGSSGYPLRARTFTFGDVMATDTLPAASAVYFVLQAGVNPRAVSLGLTGVGSSAFGTDARPQMSIVRLR